jgi:hypothetical protein
MTESLGRGEVVDTARVAALSLFVPMSNRLPALRSVTPNEWDFFFTAATVAAVALFLSGSHGLPDADREEIAERLEKAFPGDGERGVADCVRFFGANGKLHYPHRFGAWVVFNLFPRRDGHTELPDNQLALVGPIGEAVMSVGVEILGDAP